MSAVDPYAAVVGRRLGGGRYIVGERMDEGGMGAVFRAADVERGDSVAIKVLHPDLARETRHIARFYREAEAAMALRHPHIVETRTVGGPDDELCWFAMELLEGRSLHQLQRAGKVIFPPAEVIRIGRQLLSALEATHGIGVLHRDLKPGNVMVIDGPGTTIAKLVDFGIAVFTSSETYTRLTATGMILGTPAYMPPEQVSGDPLDARSDIYSLAATLHTILTGEPPYGRGNWGEILPKILTGLRTRLEDRGVDRPLASVIEQGLAVDPDARWGSAREMELALSALDVGGKETILEWRRPPTLAEMRLVPFDNTGPGFAAAAESQRPGPLPSTREQPSSEPPPMAPTQAEQLPGPREADAIVHAAPDSAITLPTRSPLWAIAVLGIVGSVVAGALVVWGLWGHDAESTEPAAPDEVQAEVAPGSPASEPPREPAIPVGVELPDGVSAEMDAVGEADEAAEADEVERTRRVRAGGRRSRRSSAPRAETTASPDADEGKEEEGPPPSPAATVATASPTAMEEEPGPRPIMVNVVAGPAMSVTAVSPRQDPLVGQTPGTHGPMVTYRTHRR